MLENNRYNRKDIFLDEEFRIQQALQRLGIKGAPSISEIQHVGTLLMAPELVFNLRVPYAVEVLGMPQAGKSTVIDRYLKELWSRNERNKVHLVDEGARTVKQEFSDLRYSDPFQYSMLGGTATFVGYIEALRQIDVGLRMVISDRGQIDRRVFRRALFSQGHVNPKIIATENQFMYGLENTPYK